MSEKNSPNYYTSKALTHSLTRTRTRTRTHSLGTSARRVAAALAPPPNPTQPNLTPHHPPPAAAAPTVATTASLTAYPAFPRDSSASPLDAGNPFYPPTPQSPNSSPALSAVDKYQRPSLDPAQGQNYWAGAGATPRGELKSPGSYQFAPRPLPTPPSSADPDGRAFHARDEFAAGALADAPLSSIAARRQREGLPRFDVSSTRTSYAGYGNFPTPPPLGSDMAGSLAPVGAGYAGYQPGSAPYGYMAASGPYGAAGMHGQNSGLRSYSSPGGYGGRSSRPDSPAAGELLASSGYSHEAGNVSYPTSGAASSLPSAAPPSSSLPAIGQGNSSYTYNHQLGGAPTPQGQTTLNSHPPTPQDPYSSQHHAGELV